MITNETYRVWLEIPEKDKLEIINKFNIKPDDIHQFLDRNDIRKYILTNYIKQGKVVIK